MSTRGLKEPIHASHTRANRGEPGEDSRTDDLCFRLLLEPLLERVHASLRRFETRALRQGNVYEDLSTVSVRKELLLQRTHVQRASPMIARASRSGSTARRCSSSDLGPLR